MLSIGNELNLISGPHPDNVIAETAAISVVRDEMWRLPFFLAYHRWLGVQHFTVIDNRSKDGSVDFLAQQKDVTLIEASGNFGIGGRAWREQMLRRAPSRRWNLIIDADELFAPSSMRQGALTNDIRDLNREGVAIATASMVDCYPERFPSDSRRFEPVPWQRAPFFDKGPYFQWPSTDVPPKYLYFGVRERIGWPQWRWRKVVPRPLRWAALKVGPPLVIKMPLLRNVTALTFKNIHLSYGVERSTRLFGLLHYKFDIDLPLKVESALAERQYWAGSREYETYAKLLGKPRRMLSPITRRFTGSRSLIDAKVVDFNGAAEAEMPLADVESQIWQYGDEKLQAQGWDERFPQSRIA